jgi:hypothetical protein
METGVTDGGGGFCTVFVPPPHPARIAVITAERSKRMLLLNATNGLLGFCIVICDGHWNPVRCPSNEERWSRMFPEL